MPESLTNLITQLYHAQKEQVNSSESSNFCSWYNELKRIEREIIKEIFHLFPQITSFNVNGVINNDFFTSDFKHLSDEQKAFLIENNLSRDDLNVIIKMFDYLLIEAPLKTIKREDYI